MNDPCSTPARHRGAIRAVLAALAAIQLLDGLYALIAPRSFYADFPLGRGWVAALPAYNEHLIRDVGGLFIATGLVLAAAAVFMQRRLIVVAAISFLAFSAPHTLYHLLNLEPYSTGDALANALALLATVILPLWVLFELRRRPPARPAATAPPAGPRVEGAREGERATATEGSGTVSDTHLNATRAAIACGCERCLEYATGVSRTPVGGSDGRQGAQRSAPVPPEACGEPGSPLRAVS